MNIVIGFSTQKKPLAWLIRAAERTPYSHVYIRYHNPFVDEEVVLHAQGFNIHSSTFDLFKKHGNIVIEEYELPVNSLSDMRRMIKFATRQTGKPYGSKQLIGMAWARFLKGITNRSHKNPMSDKEKTMVCSEFVAYAMNILGYYVDLDKAEVDGPAWINKTCIKNGLRKIS